MATDLRQTKAADSKYDAAVAAQLARAEGRIRGLDLALGGLGLLAGLLAYALGMIVADHLFDLSDFTRRASLLLAAGCALGYLWLVVLRPLRDRVNPYYAARQVENVLPGAKNSVVNWVDLHDQPLPPAIRGALGKKAAKDLRRADLEQAISGRHVGYVALAVAALGVAFVLAFLVLGPRPFFHRIARAFGPFSARGGLPTRTQLTVLRPEGGDATVTVGQPLRIVVRAEGAVPRPDSADAIRLLYRYQESEPYLERPLRAENGQDWEWAVTVRALDVRNGFWYKVAGGDAETPEYRVSVRSTPQITDFQATYRYRPYVAHIDEVRHDRALKGLRGTEVVLRARTNRTLTSARMDFAGTRRALDLPAKVVADDPQSFEVRLVLDEPGQYRLSFISRDGEPYTDLKYYPVEVMDDLPPKVELTEPGKDVSLPADGLLQLAGQATDDLGVKELTLRARVGGGPDLRPRPYRPGELQLEGGGYPVVVAYKDFLDLAKLTDADGKPLALKAGMELEYWLVATDACDFPAAHEVESKHFRVTITEPEKDEQKRQQQRDQAERERKEHQQKQDEKLKQEAEARNREQQEQQARQDEEARKREQERREREGNDKKDGEGDKGDKGEGGDKGDTGEKGDKGDKGEGKNPEGEPAGEKPEEGGEDSGEPSQAEKDRELADQARKLNEALDKKEKEQKEKGEGKGEGDADPSQAKGDGEAGEGEEKSAGEGKDGEGSPMGAAGGAKDKGKPEGTPPGEGKDPGKGGMEDKATPKGDDTGAGSVSDGKPRGEAKGRDGKGEGGKPGEKSPPARAESRKGPGKDGEAQAGTEKPAGSKPESADARRAEGKPAGSMGEERTADGKPQGEPKGRQETAEKGKGKDGGSDARASKDAPGTPKGDKGPPMGDSPPKGQGKSGGKDKGEDRVARGEAKPDSKGTGSGPEKPDPRAQKATPEDVEKLAQKAKSAEGQGERDEAREQLEKIERQAQDPDARSAAGRELDEMRREELKDQIARAKPQDPNPPREGQPRPSGEPCAECKGGGSAGGSGSAQGKGAGKKEAGEEGAEKGEGKGKGEGTGMEPGKAPGSPGPEKGMGPAGAPGEKEGEGEAATGVAKGLGGRAGGDTPGLGLSGDRAGGGTGEGPDADLPANPFPPGQHRATQMQLERFRDKVDEDILKDAKMSPEEFQAFLDSLKKRAQKQEAEVRRPEDLPGPKFGGNLPSGRGRTRTGDAGADEVLGSGRAAPPPGYRDAYREFLRKVAEKEGKE